MNRSTRVAIGAAFGSLIVVLSHPVSRTYLLGSLKGFGHSRHVSTLPMLISNHAVLPQPTNDVGASLWAHAAAERIAGRKSISKATLQQLLAVVEQQSSIDVENGFWKQVGAVVSEELGEKEKALEWWADAANCQTWNDFQSYRLNESKTYLDLQRGSPTSWHAAFLYKQRSTAAAILINRYGRNLVSQCSLHKPEDLQLRYICLVNGTLLRDNSRSIAVGLQGVDLVESACLLGKRGSGSTPRKLVTARFRLIDQFQALGMGDQARRSNQIFNDNDAWLTLLQDASTDDTVQDFSLASVGLACMPGVLLVVSLFGYAIAGFGLLARKFRKLTILMRNPACTLLGLAAGITVFLTTELGFLALTIVACAAFLGLGPEQQRSRPPTSLGPLFDFSIVALALLFGTSLALFFLGLSTPGMDLLPLLSIPEEYLGGSTLPLGLAAILFSLLLLLAPLWAMATHVSTIDVLTLGLRHFGFDCGAFFLFLGLVSIPLGIYGEIRLEPELTKILVNEPTYFLTR